MRRFVIAALILLVFAPNWAKACEPMLFGRDDIVTNEPVLSPNGRYLAIERHFEDLKDFQSARAGQLFDFDAPYDPDAPPPEPRKTTTFAIYEAATRRRLAEFAIPATETGQLFVSDSGSAVIVHALGGFCHYAAVEPESPFVTIIRSDGTTVGRLTAADVLTLSDIQNLKSEFAGVTPRLAGEEERQLLVLTVDGYDRRIDLAAAKLLDEKVNLIAQPVVFVDDAARERPYARDAFDDTSSVHLTSQELLALARDEPLPHYPEIALKAHLAGRVWIEVVVSEYGEVLAARATNFPFGVSKVALDAVRSWRFRPLQVAGKHVKYSGEVAMHFEHRVVR